MYLLFLHFYICGTQIVFIRTKLKQELNWDNIAFIYDKFHLEYSI